MVQTWGLKDNEAFPRQRTMEENLCPKAEKQNIGFKKQKRAILSRDWRGKFESDPMVSEGIKIVPRFLTSWLEKWDGFKIEEIGSQITNSILSLPLFLCSFGFVSWFL